MSVPDWLATTAQRMVFHDWLRELTQIPTAAGCEERVVAWIRAWSRERPGTELIEDAFGNLEIRLQLAGDAAQGGREVASGREALEGPLYFAAHMDHPAFVVHRIVSSTVLHLEFRGGVMPPYFENARVRVHPPTGHQEQARAIGTLFQRCEKVPGEVFDGYLCELGEFAPWVRPGMIATWDLPASEVRDGLLHAPACDDLAGAAAVLAAAETLLRAPRDGISSRDAGGGIPRDVRLLFTRAEEIGFIGAIAACRARRMPAGSRILMIENSRSFDDSPIGGGPIVRVGDRLSVFSPSLTAAVCQRAEALTKSRSPSAPGEPLAAWRWQRKLMPGGACESTVYQAYGYDTTCLCLPLGNYHNMANLASVQARGESTRSGTGDEARIAPEYIAMSDFDGLVDLLVACGKELPSTSGPHALLESLWKKGERVLARD